MPAPPSPPRARRAPGHLKASPALRLLAVAASLLVLWSFPRYHDPHAAVAPEAPHRWGLVPERYAAVVSRIAVWSAPGPVDDPENLEARTVSWLLGARRSVHAALYELSLPSVTMALVSARLHGLDVRVHLEADNRLAARERPCLQTLQDAGVVLTFDQRPALMHDKFIIVDGREVWTGSANLTWPGCHLHYNEALLVHSEALASLYEREFTRLEQGRLPRSSPAPGEDAEDDEGAEEAVDVEGTIIHLAFAPGAPRARLFLDAIASARESLRVAAFSLTHRELVAALIERAEAGVAVEVLLDGRLARTRPAQEAARLLQNAGCRVMLGAERPHSDLVARFGLPRGQDVKIHHKLVVADERTVVTGSANLSANGLERNDENVLSVESVPLARAYGWVLDRARTSCRTEDP